MIYSNEHHESILKLEDLYVDEQSFTRHGNAEPGDIAMQFSLEMTEEVNNSRRIRLGVFGTQDNKYTFKIRIVGVFTVESSITLDDVYKENMYKVNAVAILFPYLRTQLSLLTTQPGMSPVLIQPMNIVEMFRGVEAKSEMCE